MTSGGPRTGDPRTGDPRTGDPRTGDPSTGDPRTGDPRRAAPAGNAGGRLSVVGTGIVCGLHTSNEARWSIRNADRVFYLINSLVAERWVRRLHPEAVSLHDCYAEGKERLESYREMIERVLGAVRRGHDVCFVLYGHPAVFVYPSRQVVKQARAEGFEARILPAISAEDCLFADLELDPAEHGCQSFEATDFLLYRRRFDPRSLLVLWQVGLVGNLTFRMQYTHEPLKILAEVLGEHYPAEHGVVFYRASELPMAEARIDRLPLGRLGSRPPDVMSTLCVPPRPGAEPDPVMLERLGLAEAAGG